MKTCRDLIINKNDTVSFKYKTKTLTGTVHTFHSNGYQIYVKVNNKIYCVYESEITSVRSKL